MLYNLHSDFVCAVVVLKIIDESGKEREVSNPKIITHEMKDDKGNPVNREFVEFMVQGKTREWVDWCPLDVFREKNPGIVL